MMLASAGPAGAAASPGGSITWTAGAGAPVSGAAGTGAGSAAPGSFYTDSTNKINYQNIGTQAIPSWAPVQLGEPV